MLPSDEAACLDCGHPISLCDHAVKRLTDPGATFSAGIIEDLAAERDRLRAALQGLGIERWKIGMAYGRAVFQTDLVDGYERVREAREALDDTTAPEAERAGPPREGAE